MRGLLLGAKTAGRTLGRMRFSSRVNPQTPTISIVPRPPPPTTLPQLSALPYILLAYCTVHHHHLDPGAMPLATNQPVSVSSATTRRRTPWRARILCAAPSRTLHRRTEQPSRRWNTACNRDAASFVLSKRTPSTRSSRLHLCRATKPQQEDGDPTTVTASRLERADADDDSAAPSSSSSSSQADCVGVGMEVSCKLDDDEEEEDDTSPLILVAPFLFWGTSMVAMRGVVGAVDPLFVGFFRLVPSGLLLALWAAASGRPLPPTPAAWGKVAAFAAIDGAMFQAFLAIGLTRINAGLGSVIIDSQPITVCVLAALLFGERLGTTGILGLGVGVAGLGLLEVPPETFGLAPAVVDVSPTIQSVPLEDGALSGEALMFLAAQSMAVGTVMVRWVCEDVDPVVATGWHLIIGGIPLLVAAALREPHLAEQVRIDFVLHTSTYARAHARTHTHTHTHNTNGPAIRIYPSRDGQASFQFDFVLPLPGCGSEDK